MKKIILIVVCIMFAIAAITSISSTSYISHQEIDKIILKKSQAQAELLAKNVEYVLSTSSQPLDDLQKMVQSLKSRSDISYAIVINKNVQAVAHSDTEKLNKIYDDSYTVDGATRGKPQYSKWYADVQDVWVYDILSPIYVNGELYGTFDIGIPITEVSDAAKGIVITQLVVILSIFFICGIVLMWLLGKLLRPLSGLQHALENISKGDGDLTIRLPVRGNDEIAHISTAFNIFVGKINEIIAQVVNTGVDLGHSATELRSQSQQALTRGHEQSEQSLLVVTSMNEMIATIGEISQNAAGAAESAENANIETQEGQRILQEATSTITDLATQMNDMAGVITSLADRTQSIGSILEVIRGISEQTNLLALNAAIEAARAGEAGRGFAVVADEVRNLATKTAQSTNEIQTMIDQLQHEAKNAVDAMDSSKSLTVEGSQATEKAQHALELISAQVTAILDLNTQVATATEEQSSVANEININMDTVDSSVKVGLTASQELERSSQTLAELAQTLDRHVGSFKISH
ncbi:methyl-accepting chemotaxis protein [Photobacterium chitinilyticum]|uniref:Methyl-accepting chemotaxis protein n=1 Tax=Photobacterium chitinilyticum TaxID=2485123 RepID=A0A3S3QUZ1_9GAMM|nr:methyl-accepting chemotaxis protein [Photobacterium chitinilyticum]RWX57441.1 methyl-accepting chemotaxis protein [Photobacterium chitinilyticum]